MVKFCESPKQDSVVNIAVRDRAVYIVTLYHDNILYRNTASRVSTRILNVYFFTKNLMSTTLQLDSNCTAIIKYEDSNVHVDKSLPNITYSLLTDTCVTIYI